MSITDYTQENVNIKNPVTAQTAPGQGLCVNRDIWYTVILVHLIKTPGSISQQGELELVSSLISFPGQYVKVYSHECDHEK